MQTSVEISEICNHFNGKPHKAFLEAWSDWMGSARLCIINGRGNFPFVKLYADKCHSCAKKSL